MPSKPDDRATTLKKIDEIEAQMSMQWWKTKHGETSQPQRQQHQFSDVVARAARKPPVGRLRPTAYTKTEPHAAGAGRRKTAAGANWSPCRLGSAARVFVQRPEPIAAAQPALAARRSRRHLPPLRSAAGAAAGRAAARAQPAAGPARRPPSRSPAHQRGVFRVQAVRHRRRGVRARPGTGRGVHPLRQRRRRGGRGRLDGGARARRARAATTTRPG